MAGKERMAIDEVVRKVLLEDHADVVRESVRWVAQQLMESEVSELIGAELGERRPEDRATHRNGYRPRRWDTRAGEIELQIPKLRQGSYFPSFLQPRRRSEQALVAVVQWIGHRDGERDHHHGCETLCRRGLRRGRSRGPVSAAASLLDRNLDLGAQCRWNHQLAQRRQHALLHSAG